MRPAIYTAAWVLPVSAPPVRDGAVLVDGGGFIRAVGPAAGIEVGDDVLRVELGDAILLPGLINVHTHPELTAMRGLLEDLPFHTWIPTLRRTKEQSGVGADAFAAAARWSCIENLAAGVTTLAATEDSGAALDALRESGMRGVVYREAFGPSPADAGAALRKLVAKVDAMRAAETDLVRVGISPHAPYTVSDELYSLVASYAKAESLPVAVHIAESEVESQLVEDGDGVFAAGLRARGIATQPRAVTPVALLERTGVLGTQPLLIHAVRTSDEDVRRIADAGASVAHCPVANARLGHGIAPIVEMREAGVTVGIGTDSVASNNRVDLLEEARIAQLMQRARLRAAGALPARELLGMLTREGARALGIEARAGTLETGRDADLCAVAIDRPHTTPMHDPVASLLFSARGSDVMLTVVRGRVLYRDGRFLTLDPGPLKRTLEESATLMRAARATP